MYNKLKKDRLKAMKDGNKVKRTTLEMVITELDNEKGRNKEITDQLVIAFIKKEIKQLEQVVELGYDDWAETKIEILIGYLPEQLSKLRLTEIFWSIVDMKNPGDFMKHLNKNFAGQFDNKLAMEVYKENN